MRHLCRWFMLSAAMGMVIPAAESAGASVPTGYSHATLPNGWRQGPTDPRRPVLAFETSSYRCVFDLADLTTVGFQLQDRRDDGYLASLRGPADPSAVLPAAALRIEVDVEGRTYRAVKVDAGLNAARQWESGRLVQHYDIGGLQFQDADGQALGCNGTLDVVAWPDSLTMTASVMPEYRFGDGPNRGINGRGWCVVNKPLDIPHAASLDPAVFTVETWVLVPAGLTTSNGWLVCKNHHEEAVGNYGFVIDHDRVSATMNITGGAKGSIRIGQNGDGFVVGSWNHLLLSYDGSTMTYALNGRVQGTKAINLPRKPGTTALRLGNRADGNGRPVKALFDEVRVWNRALSVAEVSALATHPLRLPTRDGLVFEQTFEDGDLAVDPEPQWTGATLRVACEGPAIALRGERRVSGTVHRGESVSVTATRRMPGRPDPAGGPTIEVRHGQDTVIPVVMSPQKDCQVATVTALKRPFKGGDTDIRDYDDFRIAIENPGAAATTVPFLLEHRAVASITGICSILCDTEGRPTGIPVQLSKNWHHGTYLMAYAALPARPGRSEYVLRVIYGFYGTLPSASHAQLSLVGYGGNGRWDQLAIGCWGETICFDMDMSCVTNAVTDIRMLMARQGINGKKWGWTDAGWGGDWLGINDAAGEKMRFSGMRTAYLAQGPCLTDVRHGGAYGRNREVELAARVQTLRTDDHVRTFQHLEYRFNAAQSATSGWLYQLGGYHFDGAPMVAYGNGSGLIAAQDDPATVRGLAQGKERIELTGPGPWWVTFPGATIPGNTMGPGYRALIIRSYEAVLGGVTTDHPTIALAPARNRSAGIDLDLMLVAAKGVGSFLPGDVVTLDVELITLPNAAEDYYGPNAAFAKHLTEHPRSWTTTFREAEGNDLAIEVQGARVLQRYPIRLRSDGREPVTVSISGGVGCVPLTVEGLPAATGWYLAEVVDGKEVRFDQSVHGNDFWQVDHDDETRTYAVTFNLPLDGRRSSRWVLRHGR